jgi:hypothetical protein
MKVHMLWVVLTIAVLCAILILYATNQQLKKGFLRKILTKEGFQVIQMSKPLMRCPSGSVSFTNKKGDMDCCSTTLIDGSCPSILCTLSPVHDNLRACKDVLMERLTQRAASYCPKSKPYYFENSLDSGCSSVKPDIDGTLPDSVSKDERCKVFEKNEENYSNKNSCILQKFKEEFTCPFPSETTSLAIMQSEKNPGIIWCTSVTPQGIKQCGEDKTLLNYLDTIYPTWRNTFSLEQKSLFCSLHERAMKENRDITSFDFP